MMPTQIHDLSDLYSTREEVETRKIGRNETWAFQELFPGCTEVDEKPGKKHDIIVSFLMNSNSN